MNYCKVEQGKFWKADPKLEAIKITFVLAEDAPFDNKRLNFVLPVSEIVNASSYNLPPLACAKLILKESGKYPETFEFRKELLELTAYLKSVEDLDKLAFLEHRKEFIEHESRLIDDLIRPLREKLDSKQKENDLSIQLEKALGILAYVYVLLSKDNASDYVDDAFNFLKYECRQFGKWPKYVEKALEEFKSDQNSG